MPTTNFISLDEVEPTPKKRGRPPGSKNNSKNIPAFVPAVTHTTPTNIAGHTDKAYVIENVETDISTLPGYIPGIVNNIFVVNDTIGRPVGDMYTDDPEMLKHFKNVKQWTIQRDFLSLESMLSSIGKLGVIFNGGKKYNKVVIYNGERLT